MDVKMLPKDLLGMGYTGGCFDGHIYAIDPLLPQRAWWRSNGKP